jgi:hypothetical protein
MNNKTTKVELTQGELVWLEEYLNDCLKDNVEDEETQAFYVKVSVALGEDKSEVEKRLEDWVADVRNVREYEAEVNKLKEKYFPEEKAA